MSAVFCFDEKKNENENENEKKEEGAPSSSSPPERGMVNILSSFRSTFAGGSPSWVRKKSKGWNLGILVVFEVVAKMTICN